MTPDQIAEARERAAKITRQVTALVKRYDKKQLAEMYVREEERRLAAESDLQEARAEVERLRRLEVLEKAIWRVVEHRADPKRAIEEILSRGEEIADGRAKELEDEVARLERGAEEDRARFLRALGMDEFEWDRCKWRYS